MLGCSKQVFSKWENTPCSTHATARALKTAVIRSASRLFELTEREQEELANSAGLSLGGTRTQLHKIISNYDGKQCDMLCGASVSERMFQYYLHGKEPTKQALLAISVYAGLSLEEIEELLIDYGYCLSRSVESDAIVLWYLENYPHMNRRKLLTRINETLYAFELPLIMTKIINR